MERSHALSFVEHLPVLGGAFIYDSRAGGFYFSPLSILW